MRRLLTGNGASAWGMRLAEAEYIPVFPITPQTEIIETIIGWIESGDLDARMVTMDSEHSMITAAGTAAATGVRVFTATSSQDCCMVWRCSIPLPVGVRPFCLSMFPGPCLLPLLWSLIIMMCWLPETVAFCRSIAPIARRQLTASCWPTGLVRIPACVCR